MEQYLNLLGEVLQEGEYKMDRTGTGTLSKFMPRVQEYDLKEGFPLVTTKKTYWAGIVHELLWFISGDTNIKYLQDNGVKIWDEWADENGDLGPVYGAQWGKQLPGVIEEIKSNPNSRRLIVNSWQVCDIDAMALPPCHMQFQFYVSDGVLDMSLYQRSGDLFLGVPFNIASYSLLLMMVAQVCGLKAGKLYHVIGDAHIYMNHYKQVLTQLSREPLPLSKVTLNPDVKALEDFTFDDIHLSNYACWPAIRGAVSV